MAMDYESFKTKIAGDIMDYLPEDFKGSKVELAEVAKNNAVLDGLVIHDESSNMVPTIYLNQYYEEYLSGRSLENIMREIADTRQRAEKPMDLKVSQIMDYEKAKSHIVPQLIGKENNEAFLKDRPYTDAEDLAIVYYLDMGEFGDGNVSVPITNPMLLTYDISVEEMHEVAMQNVTLNDKPMFMTLNSMMRQIMLDDMLSVNPDGRAEAEQFLDDMLPEDNIGMWVLSNESRQRGAIGVLNKDVMDMAAKEIGSEQLYVLPSSIHEVILIPKDMEGMGLEVLENMVQEINATEVAPGDRLSDHVFVYDSVERELFRADREDAFRKEKAEEKEAAKSSDKAVEHADSKKGERAAGKASEGKNKAGKEERGDNGKKSLKDRLSSKKKEVSGKADKEKKTLGRSKKEECL